MNDATYEHIPTAHATMLPMRTQRAFGCFVGAVVLLALGLSCMLGWSALRLGVLEPPPLELQLGPYGVQAGITNNPFCPMVRPCSAPPPQPSRRYVVIWWFETRVRPQGIESSWRPLLSTPLDP